MRNKASHMTLIPRIVMTFGILLLYFIFNVHITSQLDTSAQEERKQEKSDDTSCLAKDKPKPEVKIKLGILNGKTMKMPKPIYPIEAKRKGISGEVKAEVVININTGVIEWAKIETGQPLLQEAVSKVLCRAKFFPTNDIDGRASGYLIYKFHLNRGKPK